MKKPAGEWPVLSVEEAHARLTAPGMPLEIEEIALDGRLVRVWKNAPPTMLDILEMGREKGDETFMVLDDERVSFATFYRAVCVLARELEHAGVRKGDRVALIMRNLTEWPVAFYAAMAAGAIVTPLNAWWIGSELEYGLVDCGARVAIVDAERLERISDRLGNCPALETIYVARAKASPGQTQVRSLDDIIGPSSGWAALPEMSLPDVAIGADDDATIFYTSGTTGKPKGAIATHRNINCGPQAIACVAERTYLRRGVATPSPRPQAYLLSVPLFHVAGCYGMLNPIMYFGGKLVMMAKWDPLEALRLIEREGITAAGGVPSMAMQMLEHPQRDQFDLSSLDQVFYGGAPPQNELAQRIGDTLPGAVPKNSWGMTETAGVGASHGAEDYLFRPRSCGPPVPIADFKIVDPDTLEEMPIGEVGELWCRGPHIVRGYWNKPEATAETFVDGWLRTGDMARRDDDGFYYILSRAKDMIIRGGENIYSIEVENVLMAHPAVDEAAVVAVPHHILGEEPAAVVVHKAGKSATESELCAFAAERLARFKVPVRIVAQSEPLPRNANGKVMKAGLKALFE